MKRDRKTEEQTIQASTAAQVGARLTVVAATAARPVDLLKVEAKGLAALECIGLFW